MFLGTTETYNADIKILLKKFGVADPNKLISDSYKFRRENEKSGDTKSSYESYWETLEPELITKLQEIYRRDIVFFEYPSLPFPNPFTK